VVGCRGPVIGDLSAFGGGWGVLGTGKETFCGWGEFFGGYGQCGAVRLQLNVKEFPVGFR